jgi:uncharacterized membrane protein YfcA
MELLVIFLTFLIATILSSMSGAGTSVITLPVLLSLGVNLPTAIAINQITGAFWVLPASFNYLKNRKIDWLFLLFFTLIGLIGVYVGVSTNIHIKQRYLEVVIGMIILCLVIYTYFNKGLGLKEIGKKYSIYRKFAIYPISLILGFYESFFGSGNGILFMISTFYTKGFDFIDALGHYYIVAFFWVIFSAFLYTRNGYYNVQLTIPAIMGAVMGGFIGSKFGKYKGNKVIKLIFVILGSFLGLKLIIGF